jgi:hypothetical protein
MKLNHTWEAIIAWLSRSSQPQVQIETDWAGRHWYRAYDQRTGKAAYCSDETDLRNWLDRLTQ